MFKQHCQNGPFWQLCIIILIIGYIKNNILWCVGFAVKKTTHHNILFLAWKGLNPEKLPFKKQGGDYLDLYQQCVCFCWNVYFYFIEYFSQADGVDI